MDDAKDKSPWARELGEDGIVVGKEADRRGREELKLEDLPPYVRHEVEQIIEGIKALGQTVEQVKVFRATPEEVQALRDKHPEGLPVGTAPRQPEGPLPFEGRCECEDCLVLEKLLDKLINEVSDKLDEEHFLGCEHDGTITFSEAGQAIYIDLLARAVWDIQLAQRERFRGIVQKLAIADARVRELREEVRRLGGEPGDGLGRILRGRA